MAVFLCVALHLGPHGTRLKNNAQARLKPIKKHADQYGLWKWGKKKNGKKKKSETDLKVGGEGKEDHVAIPNQSN